MTIAYGIKYELSAKKTPLETGRCSTYTKKGKPLITHSYPFCVGLIFMSLPVSLPSRHKNLKSHQSNYPLKVQRANGTNTPLNFKWCNNT